MCGSALAAAFAACLLFAWSQLAGANCVAGGAACKASLQDEEDEVSLLSLSKSVLSGMRADDTKSRTRQKGFQCDDLGPLKGLLGEWQGKAGVSFNRLPARVGQQDNSTLYIEYTENLKFEPIKGLILNRGFVNADQVGQAETVEQKIYGIMYTQALKGFFGSGIHAENGQWLFSSVPGVANWSVAKVSAFPHGTSMVAVGETSVQDLQAVRKEQGTLNDLQTKLHLPSQTYGQLKQGLQHTIDLKSEQVDYNWTDLTRNMMFGDVLKAGGSHLIAGHGTDVRATRLQMATQGRGTGFAMMEDVLIQAPVNHFTGYYWLFEDANPPVLQYFQNVFLNFGMREDAPGSCLTSPQPIPIDCLVAWPHFQLSTLTKVKEYEDC